LDPFKITAIKGPTLSALTSPTLAGNIRVSVQHCTSWTPLIQNSDSEADNDNDDILSVPPSDSADSHLAVRSPTTVVENIRKHTLKHGQYKFLTEWLIFPVTQSTWEPIGTFVSENGTLNEALMEYANDNSEPVILKNAKRHHNIPRFQFSTPQNAQVAQTPEAPRKPGFQFTKPVGGGEQSSSSSYASGVKPIVSRYGTETSKIGVPNGRETTRKTPSEEP